MDAAQLVANIYTDDGYKMFIERSSELFVLGLITEAELYARLRAVDNQIKSN